ncbi:hypothetical protein GCM10010214_62050 [Streptomyces abikoensis]|nr:hypothetical protein GCM10010214_62050 [Streptomyces abikoensis]
MEPDRVRSWERMTLYRATDAADTLDSTSLLVAAYLEHTGASTETPHRYLQCHQQLSRAAGPQDDDRPTRPGCPADPRRKTETTSASGSISSGNSMPKLSKIPRRTSSSCGPRHASLGPHARLCDDMEALEHLPPHLKTAARKDTDPLEVPQPAPL